MSDMDQIGIDSEGTEELLQCSGSMEIDTASESPESVHEYPMEDINEEYFDEDDPFSASSTLEISNGLETKNAECGLEEPLPLTKQQMIKRVHDICLMATKTHIDRFRQNFERHVPMPPTAETEADHSEQVLASLSLYQRGKPTNSLLVNVSLVKGIVWERGMALRFLTPDAERDAQWKMQTLGETAEAVMNMTIIADKDDGEGDLELVYEDAFKSGEDFLEALDDECSLETLRFFENQGSLEGLWMPWEEREI